MLRFIMTCSWQCLFAIIFCFLVEVNSISHASELVFVTVVSRCLLFCILHEFAGTFLVNKCVCILLVLISLYPYLFILQHVCRYIVNTVVKFVSETRTSVVPQ